MPLISANQWLRIGAAAPIHGRGLAFERSGVDPVAPAELPTGARADRGGWRAEADEEPGRNWGSFQPAGAAGEGRQESSPTVHPSKTTEHASPSGPERVNGRDLSCCDRNGARRRFRGGDGRRGLNRKGLGAGGGGPRERFTMAARRRGRGKRRGFYHDLRHPALKSFRLQKYGLTSRPERRTRSTPSARCRRAGSGPSTRGWPARPVRRPRSAARRRWP